MIESLSKGWKGFRLLRLILGFIIIAQAFIFKDITLGVAGLLFTIMSIFNISCCGINGCNIKYQKHKNLQEDSIEFEEVK